eukprot:2935870-Rhodomonas_salina.1
MQREKKRAPERVGPQRRGSGGGARRSPWPRGRSSGASAQPRPVCTRFGRGWDLSVGRAAQWGVWVPAVESVCVRVAWSGWPLETVLFCAMATALCVVCARLAGLGREQGREK